MGHSVYAFASWRFSVIAFRVAVICNQNWITEQRDQSRIETILHIVLKFQFERAGFQEGKASENCGVSNNTLNTVSNADKMQQLRVKLFATISRF